MALSATPDQRVKEWNKKWSGGVPVIYIPHPDDPDEDREEYPTTTWGSAFLDGAGSRAMVRLTDYGTRGMAELENIKVHPNAEQILALPKVKGEEATMRNPNCPDCWEELEWDDDFYCAFCTQRFSSSNGLEFLSRECVEYECDENADVIGVDKQPRCLHCETLAFSDEITRFAPFNCRSCGEEVVGIPADSYAGKKSKCGTCASSQASRERVDQLLGRS